MPIYLDEPGFFERQLIAAIELLPEDSVFFRNYLVELNEYYTGGAGKHTSNIKLVQLSDLHLRSVGYGLKRVVKKINELKPDLLFITGDTINGNAYLPLLDSFLKTIDHAIPKIAIVGNWEYEMKVDFDRLRNTYADNNGILLINETRQFVLKNKTVSVTGIDDYSKGNADFLSAVKEYKSSDYHIVLTHCPEHRDVISSQVTTEVPVDFILSGHTHGGQIRFFGFTPFLPRGSGKYINGWYNTTHPPLYVSKGIGTSVLPVRLGSTAEVGIFNLKA